MTRENNDEIIISGKNEETEGQGDLSIGVQENEVLQIVQNIGKSSPTSDREKSPPLMNSDAYICLETQNSESSKFSLDSDHNLSQLGSEEETRNAPIQFPEPTRDGYSRKAGQCN